MINKNLYHSNFSEYWEICTLGMLQLSIADITLDSLFYLLWGFWPYKIISFILRKTSLKDGQTEVSGLNYLSTPKQGKLG